MEKHFPKIPAFVLRKMNCLVKTFSTNEKKSSKLSKNIFHFGFSYLLLPHPTSSFSL